MMDNNFSLADLSAVMNNDGLGGSGGMWLLILLFFLGFGGNGIFGRNNGELGQYATAASQQDILFGQKFSDLNTSINKVGDGLASLGYDQLGQMNNIQMNLNNAIVNESRTTQAGICDLKTAIHSEGEATRAMLQQNKIESLQAEVNELKTAGMMANLPRINPYMYQVVPYPGCGCGNQ